ncbi:MAG: hypothetical protein ACOYY2_15465 [Actinomycetota bacterium]
MLSSVPLDGPPAGGLRLRPYAVVVPALVSHLAPPLVLGIPDARRLLDAVAASDVHRGGWCAASPTGVQVWDRPWDGPDGQAGSAALLGVVDWQVDAPSKGYLTVTRSLVTAAGVSAGATTSAVLRAILDLAGVTLDPARIPSATPPPRDPFRAPPS